jgi:hypothetical protein
MILARNPVALSFGPWQYMVKIHNFYPKPKLLQWIPYSIELVPYIDQTQWNQGQTPNNITSPGSPSSPSLLQGVNPNSPLFSNNGSPNLVQNNSALGNMLNGGSQFLQNPPQPALLSGSVAVSDFQQQLSDALQASGSANPNSPMLQGSLSTAQAALKGPSQSSDPATAGWAIQTNNLLDDIQQQLTPTTPTVKLAPMVNPNLQQLALQYYGNADDWTEIAAVNVDANGDRILTPNPIGILTLTIPGISS